MKYDFKSAEELGWAVVVAVIAYLGQIALDFDPETVQDWQTYGFAILSGVARVAVAAVGVWFARWKTRS